MSYQNDPNESFERDAQKAGRAIGKQGKKLAGKARKALAKGAKKLAIAGGKALGKGMLLLIKLLLPYIGAGLLILLVMITAYFVFFEFKGSEQQYTYTYENEVEKNENGGYQLVNQQMNYENTTIDSFYKYFSGQSFYQLVGDSKELITPDDENAVRDYHNREQNFNLSAKLLYSLDEYMFQGNFKYPEQFIQPVNYDKDNLTLINLTDDDRRVNVEAEEKDKDGNKTGSKIVSVRDYGLASIIKYGEYLRTLTVEGEYVKEDYWDPSANNGEGGLRVREIAPEPFEEIMHDFPQDIHMIDKVVSFIGEFEYTYEYKKQKLRDLTPGKTKDPKEPYVGVYYGQHKEKKCKTEGEGEEAKEVCTTTTYDLYKYRSPESSVMEELPVGKTDKSVDKGRRYLDDYLFNFETYIPEDVMNDFEFNERINFDSYVFMGLNTGDYSIGSRVNSKAYKASMQYFTIIQEFSEMYGIDPYIVVAMASQESSGDHEGNLNNCGTDKKPACGLMQIEKPGVSRYGVTQVKAKNILTGNMDVMNITGVEDVTDVRDNIKAGVMQLAQRIAENNGNIFVSIQGYNYGPGGIKAVLQLYSEQVGKSIEDIKADPNDLGWLPHREIVHRYPNQFFNWNYGTYGDPIYLERVLSYYGGNGQALGENFSGELPEGGESIFQSFGNFFQSLIKKRDKNEIIPTTDYEYHAKYNMVEDLLKVAKIMTDKQLFSDTNTDEMYFWEEGFMKSFTSTGMTADEILAIAPTDGQYYVPLQVNNILSKISSRFGPRAGGMHKGIDIAIPTGTKVYAVEEGTVTKASCDSKGCNKGGGKIIFISHPNGAISEYMHLNDYAVKVGDKVEKGQMIGYTGNTGTSSGPHLHFGFKVNGTHIDPYSIIAGGEGTK